MNFLGPPRPGNRLFASHSASRLCELGRAFTSARLPKSLPRWPRPSAKEISRNVCDSLHAIASSSWMRSGTCPQVEQGDLSFRFVNTSYEECAIILTSNRSFGEWGEVLGDSVVTAALCATVCFITRSSSRSKVSRTACASTLISRSIICAIGHPSTPCPPNLFADDRGVPIGARRSQCRLITVCTGWGFYFDTLGKIRPTLTSPSTPGQAHAVRLLMSLSMSYRS